MSLSPNNIQRSENLQQQWLYFWYNGLYTDVTINVSCGDDHMSFKAHKVVLSMWSPVFAKILSTRSSTISITDILPFEFESMLKFMYGVLPTENNDLSNMFSLMRIYRAAKRYQIPKLFELCVSYLNFSFNSVPDIHNVFDLLKAAKEADAVLLEQQCKQLLQNNTKEILNALDRDNISSNDISFILDMPVVAFQSAFDFVTEITSWMARQTASFQQDILSKILPDILQLSAKEFGIIAKEYRRVNNADFFSEQDGFKILMNIVDRGSWSLPSWSDPAILNRPCRSYKYKGMEKKVPQK